MAIKGFFRGLIRALVIAIVVFFILFFFAPETSAKYLGVSFKDIRQKATQQATAAVASLADKITDPDMLSSLQKKATESGSAFSGAVESKVKTLLKESGNLTSSAKSKLKAKLSDPTTVENLKKAAAQGGSALSDKLQELVEAVQ